MNRAVAVILYDGKNKIKWACKMVDRTSDSQVSPSLEEQVQICVREELASQRWGDRGIQSLAQRTQQLINAFASSAAGKLSGAATGLQSNGRNVPSGGNETSKCTGTCIWMFPWNSVISSKDSTAHKCFCVVGCRKVKWGCDRFAKQWQECAFWRQRNILCTGTALAS